MFWRSVGDYLAVDVGALFLRTRAWVDFTLRLTLEPCVSQDLTAPPWSIMQNLQKLTLKSWHLQVDTLKLTDTFDCFLQNETVLSALALYPSFSCHESRCDRALSRPKVDR